jgi:Fur family transcriptional regulator, ferric uptake regulator
MTVQRTIILEELGKLKTHPTADELYRTVKKRLPKISLGTVYRNLEILSGSGLIQKIEIPGTVKRFDGNADIHHHMRCISCGAVRDIHTRLAVSLPEIPGDIDGYHIVGCRLDLIGICPECRK